MRGSQLGYSSIRFELLLFVYLSINLFYQLLTVRVKLPLFPSTF